MDRMPELEKLSKAMDTGNFKNTFLLNCELLVFPDPFLPFVMDAFYHLIY